MKKLLLVEIIILSVVVAGSITAATMSSPNYKIESDSLNVGGQSQQTSTNYNLRETIGEIATGLSTSTAYKLLAGYQQMQEVYISVSVSPGSVVMSPTIGGLTGGQSNGQTTVTVITDSPSGYSLNVKANSSPALATSTFSFADYTPQISGTPDFNWSVPATTSEFGFTPEGADIVQKFKDNGSSCNTGSGDTADACWYGFSTTYETIAQSYLSNQPSGTSTTIKFRAESGNQNVQPPGDYRAVITITAVPN
jgi:hypothetical protein